MNTERALPMEVLNALGQLPMIQTSLQNINMKLVELNEVKRTVTELKADIWDNDGVEEKIRYIGQQQEDNLSEIEILKSENKNLQREVDLLKSIVIRLKQQNRKMKY
ncbi:hypothetical protein KUTeg_000645 [Tegillarca granosa]|uniref:Uncharacterized protein n=1 Tax=Tegillarca granosa TaxID=220873 RepID=A0ABQ9FY79_TEGGR|nr:hypothetical protein KUTeg_000645 [Tegillarca granosa]